MQIYDTPNARRIHDLVSAVQTLTFCVESLEKGYRFDDKFASLKLKTLRKAVVVLQNELPEMEKFLQGNAVLPDIQKD